MNFKRFIVFEGLDGAGKSTLLGRLEASLVLRHQKVTCTREPGGTSLSEELREMILRRGVEAPATRTELLLYEAARAQHVDMLIRPCLEKGEWVLCDRFTASSIAFQSAGRLISVQAVEWLNNFATVSLVPALTVLLDLPYEEAKRRQEKRFQQRAEQPDRMEAEARDFHERVRESFLLQAHQGGARWIVLSAMQSPEDLLENLLKGMEERGLWEFSSQQ
jgi:dTMP kinase